MLCHSTDSAFCLAISHRFVVLLAGACGLRPHASGASQVGDARRSLAMLVLDARGRILAMLGFDPRSKFYLQSTIS